jgi:ActR/RegA family two-component response regulator
MGGHLVASQTTKRWFALEHGEKQYLFFIFTIFSQIIEKLETESLLYEKIEPTFSMEEAFPSSESAITHALVVDDDVAVCRILHRMLSDERYQVELSHSVADAIGAVEQKSFEVYVLDYKLPDGTGLDVAEWIRSKGSDAPIVLLSGYEAGAVALRAEKLNIFDIIEKPFTRATISDAVKRAIGSLKEASA